MSAPLPQLSEETAYQAIRGSLRANWPAAEDRDIRRLALAVVYQAGTAPDRIAIAVRVIGAVRQGVDAGVWPGAHDVRAAGGVLLAGLDFALGDVSSLELAMLLRQLSTGRGEACGVETIPAVGRAHGQ